MNKSLVAFHVNSQKKKVHDNVNFKRKKQLLLFFKKKIQRKTQLEEEMVTYGLKNGTEFNFSILKT